jgi:hypothetical protein
MYSNNLSHIAPQDAVLQPDVQGGQFGTAVHGKSFSGGACDRVQKLRHAVNFLSVQIKIGLSSQWILTNKRAPSCVAAVTEAK